MADLPASANPAHRIPSDHLPQLLDRHRRGESLISLAAEYGVSDEAVRQRLDRYCLSGQADVSYHDAVTEYIVNRLCSHFEEQEKSTDTLGVARARENTSNWKWVAERRRPKLFGPKQEITADTSLTIIVQRQGETPRDITAEPVQLSDERNTIK